MGWAEIFSRQAAAWRPIYGQGGADDTEITKRKPERSPRKRLSTRRLEVLIEEAINVRRVRTAWDFSQCWRNSWAARL